MDELNEALLDAMVACLSPTTRSVALLASTSSHRGRDGTLVKFLDRAAHRAIGDAGAGGDERRRRECDDFE